MLLVRARNLCANEYYVRLSDIIWPEEGRIIRVRLVYIISKFPQDFSIGEIVVGT